jgi:cell division protease FtsH
MRSLAKSVGFLRSKALLLGAVLMASRDEGGDARRGNRPEPGPGGGGGGGPERKGPQPQQQPPSRNIFGLVSFLILGVIIFVMLNSTVGGTATTLQQFEQLYPDSIVPGSVIIREDMVTASRTASIDGPATQIYIPLNGPSGKAVAERVLQITNNTAVTRRASEWTQFVLVFGPFILLVILIYFLVSRAMRGAGGGGGMLGNFGKSRHRTLTKEMTNVTFADVAGIEEAKEEVTEIIEFLKNPKKFTRLGGRMCPRRAAHRANPVRQDVAGQGHRGRGRCALLLDQRLGLRGDVRGRGCQPRARPLQAGQGLVALHHLPG